MSVSLRITYFVLVYSSKLFSVYLAQPDERRLAYPACDERHRNNKTGLLYGTQITADDVMLTFAELVFIYMTARSLHYLLVEDQWQ